MQQAVNFTALQTLRDYSIVALVIMFGLSLAIGWWVAGRALRPVEPITTTAREITATDLSRRIAATGPRDELRTLADTIDDMLDRLDAAFRAQRALVEDVSHELRNPVAVIQANVEAVLGNEQSTPAERRDATAVVTRATGRMSRLLDDLLATARKRSAAFVDREVDLAGLTRHVAEEFALLAAERALRLDLRLASGPVVYADPASLDRALSNLLSNAVRLAPEGSDHHRRRRQPAGLGLGRRPRRGTGHRRMRNAPRSSNGSTAAPADQTDGSGLGLAIARQIVESHDGRLVLADRTGPGSTFVIWLPERAVAGAPDRTTNPPDLDPLRA